ncbi:MAG TPA: DUF2889 domain-containing protein [Pseudomonadales bacterium]
MEQSYKRRIRVRRETNRIAVDLEDNFHRFGVQLTVVGHVVATVGGSARRVPWSTCPAAVAALRDLEGHDVRIPFQIDKAAKAARHCTHLFDIARLALDHLRLDLPSRDYLITVEGPVERESARLAVDGRPARTWELSNGRFSSPPEWRGREIARMPAPAAADEDPRAFLEHMLIRRAVHIARGRFIDQDRWDSAADVGAAATCISFQPQVRASARRVKGSARDFTGREERLLADP